MIETAAIINVLPKVGDLVPIYFTVIDTDNSYNQATINGCQILYGNITIIDNSLFIANDNKPIAIAVTATFNAAQYTNILYTKCVYKNSVPDNYQRLIQKIPLGIFTKGINGEIIGDERMAIAKMLDDYYEQYLFTIGQVYSNNYSPQLEYEYNGTVSLLSNSIYVTQLFQLLARAPTVKLNSYDLELFISTYIYYRTGIISAVYIDDHVDPLGNYWILNSPTQSQLDSTTILAPASYTPAVKNLKWKIYNTSTFNEDFHREIINLIARMSRADIGNPVTFSPIADPINDGFQLIGPTYPTDPRTIFNKCLKFIGDNAFPLNVIGYVKIINQQDVIIEADLGTELADIEVGINQILGGEII